MFFFTIIFLILIGALTFAFIYFDNFTIIYFSSVALIIFLYLMLLRKERDAFNRIIIDYSFKADTEKYVNDLIKYQKRFFQTRKVKTLYGIYIAGAYVDGGKFDLALEKLLDIDKYQKYLDLSSMAIFLKIWSDFYYYHFDTEKMKRINDLINELNDKNENKKNTFSLKQIYLYQEAKYNTLLGNNLNDALSLFEKRKQFLPQVGLPLYSNTYQIAFTYLRMKNYDEAFRLFKSINDSPLAKVTSPLFIVKKSIDFYNELNEVMHKDENI